jgi:DNA replication protein DnaC
MLKTQTLEKLITLKLSGMARGLEDQSSRLNIDAMSFEERLGLLLDIEVTERENRRLKTRLTQAKLRQQACVEDIDYTNKRGLDRSLIQSLNSCKWIKEGLNVIFTGPTGVGKSYLACALAHRACIMGYKSRYFRASKLFGELSLAHADGRYPKMMQGISKMDLVVIDDWGINELDNQSRNDFLEILEDRYGLHSTIIAGQLPIKHWHKMIGHPTIADAILDRVVHNAYKIDLDGDSLRKKKKITL